jgi:hypothetical protein
MGSTLGPIFEIRDEVPCHLGDPGLIWVPCHPEEMDDAAVHFDDEKDIEPCPEDAIDVEEISGEDALCLRTDELLPRRPVSSGCR